MMYTKRKWYEDWKHSWDGGIDHTLENIIDEYPEDPEKKFDENVASVFYKFRKVLDACYAKAFSLSCMNELIESVPGFLVLRMENIIDNLATISGVNLETVRGLVEKNRPFIRFNRYVTRGPSDYIVLKAHVKDYLCDQSRSGFYYHDKKPHHISISRRGLSLMFENPWSVMDNFADDVKGYFHDHLHEHLYESDIGPLEDLSSDDPVMDLIEDLNRYVYHCEDHWNTPYLSLLYKWFAVIYIFRWLQRQQQVNSLLLVVFLFLVFDDRKPARPLLSRIKIPIFTSRWKNGFASSRTKSMDRSCIL
ncbi:hypothetical protein M413DRAFT_259747 [Hebeloma cylindrosporum]|uniref:Uncharacterized protein n=1 Tax=Hebeloma cylindrosporum TaxID=76867 RepID=A0A0C3CCZ9_HEBCY|nr:hypothetical protein M413DRAFT_259747 [Hebeloma cylindrosporum h7]